MDPESEDIQESQYIGRIQKETQMSREVLFGRLCFGKIIIKYYGMLTII